MRIFCLLQSQLEESDDVLAQEIKAPKDSIPNFGKRNPLLS